MAKGGSSHVANHGKPRAVRVDGTLLLEKFGGGFGRVEDDQGLAEHGEVKDIACGNNKYN